MAVSQRGRQGSTAPSGMADLSRGNSVGLNNRSNPGYRRSCGSGHDGALLAKPAVCGLPQILGASCEAVVCAAK